MRPVLHPRLVNGRFGDPALYVEMLHQRPRYDGQEERMIGEVMAAFVPDGAGT